LRSASSIMTVRSPVLPLRSCRARRRGSPDDGRGAETAHPPHHRAHATRRARAKGDAWPSLPIRTVISWPRKDRNSACPRLPARQADWPADEEHQRLPVAQQSSPPATRPCRGASGGTHCR
jgi:hypothetical protein